MMTKEGFIKIVNFMTPGARVLVLERGHMSHIVNMHYVSVYSTLIVIVSWYYNAAFLCHSAVKWLKYCRYDVKHYLINQSVN